MDAVFWRHVEGSGNCLLWTAYICPKGYGQFNTGGKHYKAHRYAYQQIVGDIPPGLQLDHLCRVRHCVNPEHLEPVTGKENIRRGVRGMGIKLGKYRTRRFIDTRKYELVKVIDNYKIEREVQI